MPGLTRIVDFLWAKFLRIFSPAPVPLSTQYAPRPGGTPWSVDMWRKATVLQRLQSQDDVRSLTINEIVLYKEDDLVGHEYLVVKVKSAQTSGEAWLKIQRWVAPGVLQEIIDSPNPLAALYGELNVETQQSVDPIQEVVRTQLAAKIKLLEHQMRGLYIPIESSSKKTNEPRRAFDLILQLTEPPSDIVLFSLKFGEGSSDSPLTLRDLAIIVDTIHQSAPQYEWKTRNCYWFSKAVVGVIQEIANPLPSNCAVDPRQGRPGRIKSLTTLSSPLPPVDFGPLVDITRKAIRDDDERIRKISEKEEENKQKDVKLAEAKALIAEAEAMLAEDKAMSAASEQKVTLANSDEEKATLDRIKAFQLRKQDLLQRLAQYEQAQVPSTII